MEIVTQQEKIEQIKQKASAIMHFHYCENDVEHVIETFAPDITWFGAGKGSMQSAGSGQQNLFVSFAAKFPSAISGTNSMM